MWAATIVCLVYVVHNVALVDPDATTPSSPPSPPSSAEQDATYRGASDNCTVHTLQEKPEPPLHAHLLETGVVRTARALSSLIEQGVVNEDGAAKLAKAAVANLPPDSIVAIAFGAPQLRLGILLFTNPFKLIVFQRNNSVQYQQFWKTLASPWNGSSIIWSNAWRKCDETLWTYGVAAARGTASNRAAVAMFTLTDRVPCDRSLNQVFDGAPKCDLESMECEAFGALRAENSSEYRCRCREGFTRESLSDWTFSKELTTPDVILKCLPCGTIDCNKNVLSFLYFADFLFAVVAVVIGLLVFWKRKCKAIATSMWQLYTISALGASMMFLSGACRHIHTPIISCGAAIVLRALGFVSSYGCIGLRLWCVLGEFRTRAAHRYRPRAADILRALGAMLIASLCYSFAALAAVLCPPTSWHHVTALGELILLVAGLRLAHATRNAHVPYQERVLLLMALCSELTSLCGSRGAAWLGVGPEVSAVSASLRAHVSGCIILLTTCVPKLWYARTSVSAHETSRRGCSGGGLTGAVGLECGSALDDGGSEPTASETRAELKRLYLQLEILRAHTMRRGNPHVHRRKRRRFSLQALTARRGRGAYRDNDVSRTPEDSVCSVEGPSLFNEGDINA